MEPNQTTENGETGDKSQVRSVTRALEILACFTPAKPTASLSEIARTSGLAITTASRLIATLEGARFIRRHSDGDYGLGTRLLQFGLTALSTSLYQAAEPHLQAIAAASGETANLGVLDEEGAVMYLRQIESRHAIRHATWIGRTVPAMGTAIGAAIRGEVNSDGFAATRSTLEPDVTAIAAPVYGALGQIVAALSVTGPTYRISDQQIAEYGKSVLEEARKMRIALCGN
jgi:IclR family transcriptional regulator, acetate operon repressor